MKSKEILNIVKEKGKISTQDLASKFKISRQYAHDLITFLLKKGDLIKIGSTRSAYYILPKDVNRIRRGKELSQRFINVKLKEHEVYEKLEKQNPFILSLPDSIKSILYYAFTEMFNNAIEHSKSKYIDVKMSLANDKLVFKVDDPGIGVFRNIKLRKKLGTELEAIQELLKGKTTTMPKSHSGEGIFFTSKIADVFVLKSYNYRLTVNNDIDDIFVEELTFSNEKTRKGTSVSFSISVNSKKHLNDIFRKYQSDPKEYAFDKTEIHVKLYTLGSIYISRSQARRILAGLEKFRLIILDFDQVPTAGQAFADEIFRVFQKKYPGIKIKPINMNESVKFMVERAKKRV